MLLTIIQFVITAIAAAIAIVPATFKMKAEKEKVEAETQRTLSDSAMAMVKAWEARYVNLERRVHELEVENEWWKRGCYRLLNQLVANDIEPCWDPNGGPTASNPSEREETTDET